MFRFIFLMTILVVSVQVASGHADPPMSFFPHHAGDVWEYRDPIDTTIREYNRILSDTIGPDGRYYVTMSMWSSYEENFRIDTVAFEVRDHEWGGPPFSNLKFKLDADSGASWITYCDQYDTITSTVQWVEDLWVLGAIRTVKKINQLTQNGLLLNTWFLASGLGLIERDNDTFPVDILKGAIIGGQLYGVVTGIAEPDHSTVPHELRLAQNYPNPFNPSTTISYRLPHSGQVNLDVYTSLGQHVRTVIDGVQKAGLNVLVFDGTDLSSGVYFYRLRVGSQILTGKMVLIK